MSKGMVLVVDDEENILSSLEGILHDDGYDVITVEEGETALNVIESEQPDLVLLDVWLPGMDGIEVLKSAIKAGSASEFIMMSGHGSIDTAVQATKLGAFNFIEKPLSLDNVLLMVTLAMEKRKINRDDWDQGAVNDKAGQFIGTSSAAKKIRKQLDRLVNTDEHVLITGEKGVGKSLVAKILSKRIRQSGRPCVELDCSSIPGKQANKILFGLGLKNSTKPGKIGLANNGVIILDGLDSLSKKIQEKILNALQEKCLPGGRSKKKPPLNVRVIGSISDDLKTKLEKGIIDKGLFEQINQKTVFLPALRKRPEDIEILAKYFLAREARENRKKTLTLDKETPGVLLQYSWPGNVKELKNTLDSILVSSVPAKQITLGSLPKPIRYGSANSRKEPFQSSGAVQDAEFYWDKECIVYHLKKNGWDLKKTGKAMRLSPAALKSKVQKYGIDIDSLKTQKCSYQKTLKRSVVLCGQGLHSGIKTGLILSPLPANSGIVFGDISSGETIRAHLDHVNSTDYATSLRKGERVIRTIEHILAVLHMYRINNLLIKMGDEVPIMDGSANDFCSLIEDGGLEEQDVFCEELNIDKFYSLDYKGNNGKFISIEPAETFTIHYTMEYPPPIGRQEFLFISQGKDHFKKEIAPARTFGFLKDYEKLEEMGLASGGRLSNLILLDNEKVINTTLRFPNEFVRHKILDIIGDFYLLGRPLKGKITAKMTGHRENISLLRKVREGTPGLY